MLQAPCPKLSAIAGLLREKQDMHFALMSRHATVGEVRHAEVELFRTNRLITNHRRKCSACTLASVRETSIRPRPMSVEMAN